MTSVINAAHAKHRRVTLTLSVFAWTSGQAAVQKALLGSAGARQNLARQAAAAVRDRGADGINLDFEPLVAGSEDEFVAFVRAMRAELDAVVPRAHLSFDTLGRPGNYPLERALAKGGADAVLVMGYDYRTAGAAAAGSIDPLAGSRLRPGRHRPGLHRAGAGLARDPRRPLLRPGLVHRLGCRQRAHADGRPVRLLRRRRVRDGRRATRRSTGGATTAARSRPGRPTGRRAAPRPTAA